MNTTSVFAVKFAGDNDYTTDGVISAETMTAKHAKKNENGLNIFECCTDRELHALSYLTGTPKDRQETIKRANDPLWKNLRDSDIEDIERLDKIMAKYQ